jgi:hypothetical protein
MKIFSEMNQNLNQFLSIGDEVDEGFVNYFKYIVKPVCHNETLIQLGEPEDIIDDQYIYATIKNMNNKWIYVGHCKRYQSEAIH